MIREGNCKTSSSLFLLSHPHTGTGSHSSLALNNPRKREIAKYKRIAINESSPAKGGFLYAFLLAFKRADDDNALILLPAMRKICRKYGLSGGQEVVL